MHAYLLRPPTSTDIGETRTPTSPSGLPSPATRPTTVDIDECTLNIRFSPESEDVVNAILDAVRLPREIDLNRLCMLISSGRLFCACGDPAPSKHPQSRVFCRACRVLAGVFVREEGACEREHNAMVKRLTVLWRSADAIVYHMKAKHAKSFYEDDLLCE
ncbi:hypothetical protein C8Q80DRAFT_1274647 [Daedaleopsis nitida]|nr:hypothetical protein C8Q80DRAFT_1274647 [Daedaleopsis nitida]